MQDLTEFDFGRACGKRIDYSRLLDGGIHKLMKGIDYYGDSERKRRNLQTLARYRGMKLRTSIVDDGQAIVAQAIEVES